MKSNYLSVSALVLCLALHPVSSSCQRDAPRVVPAAMARILKGLQAVDVLVESDDKTATDNGLEISRIQSDTESQLRHAGLSVVERKGPRGKFVNNSCPHVFVDVNLLRIGTTQDYVVTIEVRLVEDVRLLRSVSTMAVGAITWHKSTVGYTTREDIPLIRTKVKDLVDLLCSDYLKANPTK